MHTITVISVSIHEEALREAGKQDQQLALNWMGLNAPLSDDVLLWADRIWDQVDTALRKAWSSGYEASREFITAACKLYDEATTELKSSANQVSAIVIERLDAYVQGVINGALRRLKHEIIVGEQKLKISSISIDQKLKMSSSLEVSLHQICKFAADGELTVGARYESYEG